jgi:hypothetical protein
MLMRLRKKGQSVVEFAAVVMFILAAFLIFQKYIVRSFSGRWKQVGDVLGQGRIYDPKKTIECAFDPPTGVWFDKQCYDVNCTGACLPVRGGGCDGCITATCQSDYCDE